MITDKVCAAIRRHQMLSPGCHVVVGVSGGADSTALLHLLHTLSQSAALEMAPFSLSAAHLNHGIRGWEADRDEDFVRELCREWGIPLQVEHADIPALCRQTGEGLEECARRIRYDFLQRCAQGGKIATAHTATDNVETFFMHVLRGSALRGLGGIPPVRDNIVRPLLDCSREEVEEHCRQAGLSYVNDSTNATDDCLRNRIRHHLLPVLEQLEPGVSGRMGRMMEHLRQDEAHLAAQAENELACLSLRIPDSDGIVSANTGTEPIKIETDFSPDLTTGEQNVGLSPNADAGFLVTKLEAQSPIIEKSALGLRVEKLRWLTPALRSRILLLYARQVSPERIESRHIDALETLVWQGGAATLPGGVRLVCRDGLLYPQQAAFPPVAAEWQILLEPGMHSLPNGRYRFSILSPEEGARDAKIYKLLLNHAIDYDKIWGKAVVRTRRPGDAVSLPGRPRKSLKKLLSESHVPIQQRTSLLILADEAGVIFAEGFGPDSRCAPDSNTTRLLLIERLEDAHA